MCTIYIDSLVKHMCNNNNNTINNIIIIIINSYFCSFDVLDWFKLYDDSCFCLLCSINFITIFLLSLFY
jgi:hypothetical protein